jgi:hypothetical protein
VLLLDSSWTSDIRSTYPRPYRSLAALDVSRGVQSGDGPLTEARETVLTSACRGALGVVAKVAGMSKESPWGLLCFGHIHKFAVTVTLTGLTYD